MRPDALFIFPPGNIEMPTVTFVDLSGNHTDISPTDTNPPVYLNGIDHIKPLIGKPHPVDEFALEFYKTHEQMRLDFGDLMSYKFQADREPKEDTKQVRLQLLKIKINDYKDKVKSFFTDLDENLTKW